MRLGLQYNGEGFMKNSELQKMEISTNRGTFSPAYTYSDKIDMKNEDGEVVDYEYTDFILHKTAEEVYQEYLNPHPPQPTVEDFNLEMDYRITMLEMIGGI